MTSSQKYAVYAVACALISIGVAVATGSLLAMLGPELACIWFLRCMDGAQ